MQRAGATARQRRAVGSIRLATSRSILVRAVLYGSRVCFAQIMPLLLAMRGTGWLPFVETLKTFIYWHLETIADLTRFYQFQVSNYSCKVLALRHVPATHNGMLVSFVGTHRRLWSGQAMCHVYALWALIALCIMHFFALCSCP